jgi:hypothetical protein
LSVPFTQGIENGDIVAVTAQTPAGTCIDNAKVQRINVTT